MSIWLVVSTYKSSEGGNVNVWDFKIDLFMNVLLQFLLGQLFGLLIPKFGQIFFQSSGHPGMTDNDKHSSLLLYGSNYGGKKKFCTHPPLKNQVNCQLNISSRELSLKRKGQYDKPPH